MLPVFCKSFFCTSVVIIFPWRFSIPVPKLLASSLLPSSKKCCQRGFCEIHFWLCWCSNFHPATVLITARNCLFISCFYRLGQIWIKSHHKQTRLTWATNVFCDILFTILTHFDTGKLVKSRFNSFMFQFLLVFQFPLAFGCVLINLFHNTWR